MKPFAYSSLATFLFIVSCADGGGMRPADGAAGDAATDVDSTDVPALDVDSMDAPMSDVPVTDAPSPLDGGADAPAADAGADAPAPMDAGDDAPIRDAGPDVPAVDAGDDAGDAGCTSTSCDNGNPCDGLETCVAGSCRAGTPVTCTDGIACTTDRCNPATGMCDFMPVDSMCAGALICTSTGCVDPGCGESPCQLVGPQCGCPAGEGCYLTDMGDRICAFEGTSDENESCDMDICSAGNICIDISGDGAITSCREFCDTDTDCNNGGTEPGSVCLATVTGTTQQICTVDCDPTSAFSCSAGTGCNIFEDMSGRRLTDCAQTGTRIQGQSCVDREDCAPAFDCVDTGPGGLQCLRNCTYLPAGFECGGLTCTPFGGGGLVFNGIEYGACL